MPISAIGNNVMRTLVLMGARQRPVDERESGFTLVELMVVVTVIALASAIAIWALPDPQGRVVDEAARFAVRTRAAHDSAIVESRPVSVWVTAGGYGYDRRIGGAWTAISEKPLRVTEWSKGTEAALDDPSRRVRITFDTTGLADRATTIRLSRRGAQATVQIAADGGVRIDG